MSVFENVTVVKAANVYFDGKVTSRIVRFADGSEKTLGFMQTGDYTFNTDVAEIMEIIAGDLEVLLPNHPEWQTITGGQSFEVPAQAEFSLKIKTPTDYCCSYLR